VFDAVALDPPTFSQSKEHGLFRAEKDFGKLVAAALPLVRPGGVLFARDERGGLAAGEISRGRGKGDSLSAAEILQRHHVPQPPDFPISRARAGVFENGNG